MEEEIVAFKESRRIVGKKDLLFFVIIEV